MKRTRRVLLALVVSFLVAGVALSVWSYARPISVSASTGMTLSEARVALETEDRWDYDFYSDPKWCARGIFGLGEAFSYHTWIGFTTDEQGRIESARGYHAVTIDLPLIGFHDHEFPSRPVELAGPQENQGEQGVAPQSATRSESGSEGSANPQPESKPRPR